MQSFTYIANPVRVVFGSGTVKELAQEITRLHAKSPFLLSSARQGQLITTICNELESSGVPAAEVYTGATMHTPSHVTEQALSLLRSKQADAVVSVGGGSTIGLGKALADRTGLPHVCVPTTYAGSEMTPILGETFDGRKHTRSGPKLLPVATIYDAELTMTLSPTLTATSGVNAIAHAVESLYAPSTNPVIIIHALSGIGALVKSLPILVREPQSLVSREQALYGAWLCGMCLGVTQMGLHHKVCHTLGGSFGLPHAETHAIVLPHVLAYNAPAIPEVMSQLTSVLPSNSGNALDGFNDFLARLNLSRALSGLGMKEADISMAARIVCESQYKNPRPLVQVKIEELIRRCFDGEVARADL